MSSARPDEGLGSRANFGDRRFNRCRHRSRLEASDRVDRRTVRGSRMIIDEIVSRAKFLCRCIRLDEDINGQLLSRATISQAQILEQQIKWMESQDAKP